jgi:hypothetical protein
MTAAPFLSRHLGDYLLVAQLSDDALGPVFRALYAPDERRFVRLRILKSDELSAEALAAAIRDHGRREPLPRHDAIVRRPQLDMVENLPILAWDEIAGWTLDVMLARVRAFGIRIPAEYALLIAERIAAGLEHAHEQLIDNRPSDHGLLWPGFVAISHDASVRVGGFGIAEAVYPSLTGRRLSTDLAPYVAPEARSGCRIGPSSDVYSLGVILAELLTGRRPSLDAPSVALRAGDARSEELEAFLQRCLADPEERFESAVDAHRALQQMVTGNPFSLYTANLALFLYKLLNPESQSVATSADMESTNPVVVSPSARAASDEVLPPVPELEDPSASEIEQGAAVLAIAPGVADPPHALAESAGAPASLLVPALRVDLTEADRPRQPFPFSTAWRRPAAALAAAAGITVGAFLVIGQIQSSRTAAAPERARVERPRLVAATDRPAPAVEAPAAAGLAVAPPPVSSPRRTLEKASPRAASAAPAKRKIHPELRQPAEDLRLHAALARIEADRVNARETAGDLFGKGRHNEEEGERFLRQRDYDAAQLAFSRAARFFQQAQELTWEERLRQSNLGAQ